MKNSICKILQICRNILKNSIISYQCVSLVVCVFKKVSLKQNKSHCRSLDLHLVFIISAGDGLPK